MSTHKLNHVSPSAEADLQDQLADFWQILRRHWGLFLTTLVIVGCLGVLYYLKAPRVYESQADLLIENKISHGFRGDNDEPNGPDKTIETHALMLQSSKVILRAIKKGQLDQLGALMEEEDVVNFIIENSTVSLKDEKSTVLNLRFCCSDPEDARVVVDAIATSYQDYLNESNKTTDSEKATLIEQANKELLKQLIDNEQKLSDFQKNAPVMWNDGQAVNKHQQRQAEIEKERQALMLEKTVLAAKVEEINKALANAADQSDSYMAIYYSAMNELKPDSEQTDYWVLKLREQKLKPEQDAASKYSSLLMDEYVRLMVQGAELLDQYGDGHPEFESVTKRKNEVKRMLNNLLTENSPLEEDTEDTSDDDIDYVKVYVQLLRDRLAILERQVERLDEDYETEQMAGNKIHQYIVEFQQLNSQREHTKKLFDVVVADLKEIELIPEHGGDTAEIIAEPELGKQVAPTIPYVGIASLFLGCLFGGILAWAVDRTEDTFRSANEIRERLQMPVIGCIPHMRRRDQIASANAPQIAPIVSTLHQDKSQCSEAYRGVRTKLYFSAASQDLRVIQITSPLPGDGKSTVTANLAVAIAKSGKRVLVLDADFRRPSMIDLLGKPAQCEHGLASIIAGNADPVDANLATDVPNLFFLPALERPLNPSELLSTPQFKHLLDVVRERFDFVLIDTPPLLAVTDPCAVAARADGVLLTLRIRKGVQDVSSRALDMLRSIDANVLGTVVNGVDENSNFEGISGKYGNYGYAELYTDHRVKSRRRIPRESLVKTP